MEKFTLLAKPFWVNAFVLIPFVFYYFSKKSGLAFAHRILLITAIFGVAFGLVEAAAVVYLRAAVGLLSGYGENLILAELPKSLLAVEIMREAATIIMLASISVLAIRGIRERLGIFLWTFAFWDIFYYVGLWFTIRWPASLTTPDVLFLIPAPWYSQVCFRYS